MGPNCIKKSSGNTETSSMHSGLPEPSEVTQAVDLFISLAYPAGLTAKVRAILDSLHAPHVDFYANSNFVRGKDPQRVSYYLRLGNARYPHTKLFIEPCLKEMFYCFRVDSHDKHVIVPPDNPEYGALCDLRRHNQKLAEAIESAWREAGIPTFTECLEHEADRLLQAAV
jgi:hypothetical protein